MDRGVLERLRGIVARARDEGRAALHDHEALDLVDALGFRTPARRLVRDAGEAARLPLDAFPGDRVVVKGIAAPLLHKSDAGAVAIVDKRRVAEAVAAMAGRLAAHSPVGFGIHAFVPHDRSFGVELLLGARWSAEFGSILTLGPGGVLAEHLAAELGERGVAIVLTGHDPAGALAASSLGPVLSGRSRLRLSAGAASAVREGLATFSRAADALLPGVVREIEINPWVLAEEGPVALDARVILGDGDATPAEPPRSLDAARALAHPRSIAIVGVSERLNPGRRILRNVLRAGFDPQRVTIVKPGVARIDGCRCVADLSGLGSPVDMLVVAVDAARVPEIVEEAIARRSARGLVVIPGGLGELPGTEDAVERIRAALRSAREEGKDPPVVNGGNCLGIVSRRARCDTFFLPPEKLPPPSASPAPVALLSQSGAFAASRASRLAPLDPCLSISVGNQIDLTVGDWLEALEPDRSIEVFACYVEGFRSGDGRRFVEAASRIVAGGRGVVLYRAGRTSAGAGAAASHTASVAGDWPATRALARAAGVAVAETLDDFDDLVRLFAGLAGKSVRGRAVGAVSNAGFECVAIADSFSGLAPAALGDEARRAIGGVLRDARLDAIVDVRNPLDVTPILGDEGYAETLRAVVNDPGVDLVVAGCVPLTGAMETLPPLPEGSVAHRVAEIARETAKPLVAVVDAGTAYAPMVALLEGEGVPVFRSADRALRALSVWTGVRLRGSAA